MGITLPPSVVESAKDCPHELSCLETRRCGDREMCVVRDADGQDILFLKDKKHADCTHRLPFGTGQICRCPVHFWLYKNSRI